jgi:hypothetical protein
LMNMSDASAGRSPPVRRKVCGVQHRGVDEEGLAQAAARGMPETGDHDRYESVLTGLSPV